MFQWTRRRADRHPGAGRLSRRRHEAFRGKAAIVTGAGSGTGEATAQLLAEQGAAVTVVCRRADRLEEVARRIRKADGPRAAGLGRREQAVGAGERGAKHRRGIGRPAALHYAVNNAAVTGVFSPTGEMSVEDWQRVVGINLSGLFYDLPYEIPAIFAAGGGAIVNVSSVFADRGGPTVEYSTAKHGIRGLTRTAAKEYRRKGIRII